MGVARQASLLFTIVLGLASCDEQSSGAAGTITAAEALDTAPFTALEIRAYPDESADFDVANLPVSAPSARLSVFLAIVSFPYGYDVVHDSNPQDHRRWRMTAWLSRTGGADRPEPGAPLCSVPFTVDGCDSGRCGIVDHVNCTLR